MDSEKGECYQLGAAEQLVRRERRGRVSQLAWCGEGCFDSRRRVNSSVGRVNSSMKYLILVVAAVSTAFALAPQKTGAPEGWTKINVCHISFFAPPDMKDLGTKGLDSCVAQFANKDITVYLDYGQYG